LTQVAAKSGRGSGPKGIRTPDLLAASQKRANGVLTCENAGRRRAETAKLWGEAKRLRK